MQTRERFIGNYAHCKGTTEGRLVWAVPMRGHMPLRNAAQVRGNICLVQRGECSFAKKMRYVQEAGAAAMLVVGTDYVRKPLPLHLR